MTDEAFIIAYLVRPQEPGGLPDGMTGAYVKCFTASPDIETAIRATCAALLENGLNPVEVVDDKVYQLKIADWGLYVSGEWPEYASHLPTQEEFEQKMAEGKVVYGPFAGFNDE